MSSQQKIICYGSTGTRFGNNTKCPDSDSCCQTADQCRPDRLCVSNKDPDTLVRAPCSANPWNDNCAKVCIEEDSSGFLPRVNICRDGSYCCVKDPTCCADKRGFFLNDDGSIKRRANETLPEETTSEITPKTTSRKASSTTTTSISVPNEALTKTPTTVPTETQPTRSPTSTIYPDNPQPALSSPGISRPAKFGIGFGVSFGVILLGLVAFFAWRSRQRKSRLQVNPSAYPNYDQSNKIGEVPVELPTPQQQAPVSELEGYHSRDSRK
ncbi:hypothetical protein I7I48_05646 [Histoplasma ohiense]|nr:hypothetical protein I7I48_05646 [Histoplasma ohiense (nom. inval.)]